MDTNVQQMNEVPSDQTVMILVDSPKYIVLRMAQCNGHKLLVTQYSYSVRKEKICLAFPYKTFPSQYLHVHLRGYS